MVFLSLDKVELSSTQGAQSHQSAIGQSLTPRTVSKEVLMQTSSLKMMVFLNLLLNSLFAPIAQAAPQFVTKYGGISEYKLENGLRILLFPEPASATLTVNVTYLVGSRHEGYGETGMAHLLEHLVFKNTKKYSGKNGAKTPVQILNELGGRFNGTTSRDRTNYFINVPASQENLDLLLSLESERMGHSLLDPKDLWDEAQKKGEMTVVRNEFEADENRPISVTYKRLLGTAFDWHNYGNPTIGARSDIENVGIEQIRSFYETYYQPDNAVLLIAGNLDEQAALALIDKHFAAKPRPSRVLRDTYTREPPQDGDRRVTVRREGDTPLVMIGYKVPAGFGKEGTAANLLGLILANEPSGRLYKTLVKDKLATKVINFGSDDREPGILISLALLSSNGKVDQTEAAMIRSLETISKNKITPQEVERAKLSALRQWEQSLSQPDQLGIALSEYIAQGDWRLFFVSRQLLEATTTEDIQSFAEKYLRSSNRTVATFIPVAKSDAIAITEAESVSSLVAALNPDDGQIAGEAFDVSPLAIEERVKRETLTEQLQIALLPKKTRGEVITGTIALRLGNEQQLTNQATIGYVTGLMLLRGTNKYSRQALKDKLDRIHSEITVNASAEVVYLSFKTKKQYLAEVLDLAREVFVQPTFPQDEFDQLIAELKTSLEYARTEPNTLALHAMAKHLSPYPPGHVRYPANTNESLTALSKVKRNDIRAFHKAFYGATGQIALVGDFDSNSVKVWLRKHYAGWKARVPYERVKSRYFDVKPLDLSIPAPGKANAYLGAGLNLALGDTHADYPALFLGNYMLGGGSLRSRLADRIRQKEGLSYGVSSSLQGGTRDPVSKWTAMAIFNPTNVDKVTSALKEEIAKVLKDGFTAKEVALATSSIKQAMKVARANDKTLAFTMIEQMQDDRTWVFQDQFESAIATLTPQEIAETFKRYIDLKKISLIKSGNFVRAADDLKKGH